MLGCLWCHEPSTGCPSSVRGQKQNPWQGPSATATGDIWQGVCDAFGSEDACVSGWWLLRQRACSMLLCVAGNRCACSAQGNKQDSTQMGGCRQLQPPCRPSLNSRCAPARQQQQWQQWRQRGSGNAGFQPKQRQGWERWSGNNERTAERGGAWSAAIGSQGPTYDLGAAPEGWQGRCRVKAPRCRKMCRQVPFERCWCCSFNHSSGGLCIC